MPTKVVRFARFKNPDLYYAGHYTLPSIEENDVVEFMTLTLDVTLTFRPALRAKFLNGPEEIRVTPDESQTLTALQTIELSEELRRSNMLVKATDWADNLDLNYCVADSIEPCTP